MSTDNLKSGNEPVRLSALTARRFLENLARLDRKTRTREQVKAFHQAFGEILGGMTGLDFSDLYTQTTIEEETLLKERRRVVSGPDEYRQDPSAFVWDKLQPFIREVWREQDTFIKECAFLRLAGVYMAEKGKRDHLRGRPALLPDKFLLVLLYALKNVHLLHYCQNRGYCKRHYFIAARASQVYCCEACAKPAQRKAKKEWWDKHGEEARRKRREKQERGKHAKTKKA